VLVFWFLEKKALVRGKDSGRSEVEKSPKKNRLIGVKVKPLQGRGKKGAMLNEKKVNIE